MRFKLAIATLFFVTVFLSSCQCGRNTASVESWQLEPSLTTTAIRVSPTVLGQNLDEFIKARFVRVGFSIDTTSVSIKTQIRRVENYYIQLFASIKDTSVIITGRYGNIGLNGIALGEEPTESNINWENISFNSRGWEKMHITGMAPEAIIMYNLITPSH